MKLSEIVTFLECNIKGGFGFQTLQNFWVAKNALELVTAGGIFYIAMVSKAFDFRNRY